MKEDLAKIKGFSLFELIISLGLFSLLLGLSIPKLWSLSEKRLGVTARELDKELDYYYEKSKLKQADIRVLFKKNSTEIKVLEQGVTHVIPLEKNLSISDSAFGNFSNAEELIFYPSGTATPGKVTIRNTKNQNCTLTQQLNGNRRIAC